MADELDSVILARLRVLHERLNQLERYRQQATDLQAYLDNEMLRDAVERSLQVAIETCLDVGRRLITIHEMEYPETNQRVFAVLAQNSVISIELQRILSAMVGFRNIIVHDYAEINNETVFDALNGRLDDIRQFAQAIQAYLAR